MYGTVTSVHERGFCFVEADGTCESIFIHQKSVKGRRNLHLNDRVKFDIAPSQSRPDLVEGVNVELVAPGVRR
jgi:cold shock CspA family protein